MARDTQKQIDHLLEFHLKAIEDQLGWNEQATIGIIRVPESWTKKEVMGYVLGMWEKADKVSIAFAAQAISEYFRQSRPPSSSTGPSEPSE